MSTIVEVRPTGTVATVNTNNVGGAATPWQALQDNLTTTYTLPTALGNYQVYDVGSYSLAANERIEQVQWALTTRSDDTAKASNFIESVIDPVTGVESTREQQWAFRSLIQKQFFGWKTKDPNGNPWTQAVLDRLQIRFGGVTHPPADLGTYTYPRFYEAFVRIQYDTQPTVGTPTIGSLETSRPAFSYVYADADLDPQTQYQAKVYSAAQYGAGGFSPDSSAATWDSGVVKSTLNAGATQNGVIGIDLAPGTTYRLYVRAARNFMGVDVWWSDWAFVGFTTVVSLPEVPTIVTTADNTNGRVQIDVQARVNALSAQDSSLESTGVGNWASAANCTVSRVTTDASHGTGSLQLSSSAGGNMSARIGTAGRIACAPGVVLTAVADFRAAVSVRSCRIDIEWYNAGGGLISTTVGTAGNDAVGSYTQRVCTAATAPVLTATATVLVNVLSTGGAAEVHRVDRIGLTVGSSTTWGLGGYLATADHQLEVSDDGGVTWTAPTWLRQAVDQTDQANTIYDYSAPRGTLRSYRARTEIETPTVITSDPSATDSETLSLPSGDVNLWLVKDLLDSTKNFSPRVAALTQQVVEDADVLRVEGRTNPIVVAGTVGGTDGTITLGTLGLAQWRQAEYFVRLQRAFLVQGPDGQQWLIRVVGDRGITWGETPASNMLREVSLPYAEQDDL